MVSIFRRETNGDAQVAGPPFARDVDPDARVRRLVSGGLLAAGRRRARRWVAVLTTGLGPDVDVRETSDAYVFEADLPGMRQDEVHIAITGNHMTISGRRGTNDEGGASYHRRERPVGVFDRRFRLPDDVSGEQVTAALRDGVLTVRLPKSAETRPRPITIKSEHGQPLAQA